MRSFCPSVSFGLDLTLILQIKDRDREKERERHRQRKRESAQPIEQQWLKPRALKAKFCHHVLALKLTWIFILLFDIAKCLCCCLSYYESQWWKEAARYIGENIFLNVILCVHRKTKSWILDNKMLNNKKLFLRGGCDAFKCSLYANKCSSRFCPQQKNNNLKESEWGQNRHGTRGAAREETNRRIVMAGARPRGRADKKKEKGLWIETFFPLEEISFIRSRT